MPSAIRLGTRSSKLSMVQVHQVVERLHQAYPDCTVEVVPLTTRGDLVPTRPLTTRGNLVPTRPLTEIGGKGLFVEDIEKALHDGIIDAAVHSMKDVPARLHDGMVMDCFLPRMDARDALCSRHHRSLKHLPPKARLGTSAPRRIAQVLAQRPDLTIVPLRGNVDTRITALHHGEVEAVMLAYAGLMRLSLEKEATEIFPTTTMLPCTGQGTIAVEYRGDDLAMAKKLAAINHAPTAHCAKTERAFLAALGGSCATPVASLAELDGKTLKFRCHIFENNGGTGYATVQTGSIEDGEALGRAAGEELRQFAKSRNFPLMDTPTKPSPKDPLVS